MPAVLVEGERVVVGQRQGRHALNLAVRSQYWMLGVMVGFTSLALWLLSSSNL